jgi:hypothetical protein
MAATLAPSSESVVAVPVSEAAVQTAVAEDTQIAQAATPAQQQALTVNFAQQKIDSISTLAVKKDFATTDFVVNRLDHQVDALLANPQAAADPVVQQQVQVFKQKAETNLRSNQLIVTEGSEEDMEIVRAKLMSL